MRYFIALLLTLFIVTPSMAIEEWERVGVELNIPGVVLLGSAKGKVTSFKETTASPLRWDGVIVSDSGNEVNFYTSDSVIVLLINSNMDYRMIMALDDEQGVDHVSILSY